MQVTTATANLTAIEHFKLAAIETGKFTDLEIERLFFDLEVESREDIIEVTCILQKHRTILFRKLNNSVRKQAV